MKGRTEVAVGAVILFGLALAVFGTLWLQGAVFGEEEVLVRARFRGVGQLEAGNPVTLRGVPIGEVAEIALEPGGNAVIVAMRIDNTVALPEDAVVLLSPESLFGDWQAQILPRDRFPQYSYLEAPDPEVLPGGRVPDISQLAAVADRIAQNLAVLTDRVELAFTEDAALDIRRAIENISAISEDISGLVGAQERALRGVTTSLDTTITTLNQTLRLVRGIAVQLNTALDEGEVEAIVDNIQSTTAQTDSLTEVLLAASDDLRSTAVSADSTLEELERILSSIEQGRGTLGALVNDSSLYQQLVETNLVLQQLLLDLRENPERYINLRVF